MRPLTPEAWADVVDNYGPATAIPELIERIQAGEAVAFHELYGRAVHQGTPSQAIYEAMPHLLRIAQQPGFDLATEMTVTLAHVEHEPSVVPALAWLRQRVGQGDLDEGLVAMAVAAHLERPPTRAALWFLLTAWDQSEGVVFCETCEEEVSCDLDAVAARGDPAAPEALVRLARAGGHPRLAAFLDASRDLGCGSCGQPVLWHP